MKREVGQRGEWKGGKESGYTVERLWLPGLDGKQ